MALKIIPDCTDTKLLGAVPRLHCNMNYPNYPILSAAVTGETPTIRDKLNVSVVS